MDLETVGRKLEHKPERGVLRQYREPAEFREDMRQIWTNCRLYNAVGTPVRGMVRPARRSWARSHAPLAGAQPAGREPAAERRGSGLWGPARSSARACWGTGRQRRSARERGTGACCPAARGGAPAASAGVRARAGRDDVGGVGEEVGDRGDGEEVGGGGAAAGAGGAGAPPACALLRALACAPAPCLCPAPAPRRAVCAYARPTQPGPRWPAPVRAANGAPAARPWRARARSSGPPPADPSGFGRGVAIQGRGGRALSTRRARPQDLAGGAEALPERVAAMARELQALADAVEQREGAAGAPPGGRDMTFEEKRRLSHALGALPGDRLGRVLDIIRESQPVDEARRPPGPARRGRLTAAAAMERQPCGHCCAGGPWSDIAWLMCVRSGVGSELAVVVGALRRRLGALSCATAVRMTKNGNAEASAGSDAS